VATTLQIGNYVVESQRPRRQGERIKASLKY
jgi:hypothetical protein